MKIRDKNPLLQGLIQDLDKQGRKAPLWKAVAKGLNRPRRKGYEINLFEIERSSGEKEAIVVPGIVLGSGELSRPLTIAALKFSGTAKQKIEKAGGSTLTIGELMEKNPEGKGIRILG